MKAYLSALIASLSLITPEPKTPIDIHFDKNMELLGYIVELGDPSDNDPNHPISMEINKWPEDKNSPLLYEIFEIAGEMNYSLIVNLMYSLPDFPLQEGYEIPEDIISGFGSGLPEEMEAIERLINKVNEFSKQSNFEKVWTGLEPHREKTLKLVSDMKPSESLMAKMEEFYEREFSKYEIVPSLTIWSGPGWGIKDDKTSTATFVLGPLKKNYDFGGEQFLSLTIHEFGHSFVNEVVLQNKDLINNTESLFASIKEDMTGQGYSKWGVCLYEHFVRAGEIIIPELIGDNSQSDKLMKEYTENRKFIYLPYIVDRLRFYRTVENFSYQESVRKTLVDVQNKYN